MSESETLKCSSCGWRVPVTNQASKSTCWSCCEGIQENDSMSLNELRMLKMNSNRRMIRNNLSIRFIN